jgi:acyl-CoA reductase-like NAD-dependent aldehyde dehydrogenase
MFPLQILVTVHTPEQFAAVQAALNGNKTEAVGAAPAKVTRAAKAVEKATAQVEAAKPVATAPAVSRDEVIAAASALAKSNRQALVDILAELGFTSVSATPPERYGDLLAAIKNVGSQPAGDGLL